MSPLHPVLRAFVKLAARMLGAASLGALALIAMETLGGATWLTVGKPSCANLAFLAGLIAQMLFYVQMVLVALIAPWCVRVLLARGCNELLRALAWASAFLGVFLPVNLIASIVREGSFPVDPGSLTLVLACALGLLIAFAAPFFQAAPRRMQLLLFATALLFPACVVLNVPSLFLWQDAGKMLLSISLFLLAGRLAQAVFFIASLPPERAEEPPQP